MEPSQIVDAARLEGTFYDDLVGLGQRAFPDLPEGEQVEKVAGFVLRYEQMWHDMRCAYYSSPYSLFLKHENGQPNPNIVPVDYLKVFGAFMKRWAARQHEGSPDGDWYKMQDEFSRLVN